MSLDLTHNDLCDAADAFASLRAMPSLRALSLAGNPMAMGTRFAARVANELPELLMLDGARLEHAARGPMPSMDDEDATPPRTLTVKFKVTDASCEPDPPPPTDPIDEDEAKKKADDEDVKAEGDAEGGEGEGDGEGDVPAEGEGGAEGEGDGEAAGGDALDAKEAAPVDDAEFFVRFSLAACGGGDDDAALAEPFAIPRRPRTVPESEVVAEGEKEGEGEGDGGDAPEEAAAAEGEGEGEGEEAAAPTPPVEEPDDPATTFYADLPLTLATRDLLHRGVRFEMCKVETVPRPPAETPKETTGDAADGADKPEGEPEAEPAEGSEAQSELVERVTVVGVATVRLGSLLSGGVKEWRGEVDFFREAPMYRKTAVGEVLVALGGDGSGAGESAGRATVTCVMHATRPAVEGEGAEEEGEEAAAEE
jgi:hypothetical protein